MKITINSQKLVSILFLITFISIDIYGTICLINLDNSTAFKSITIILSGLTFLCSVLAIILYIIYITFKLITGEIQLFKPITININFKWLKWW